jgi:uncharacterized protein YegJ (DUF2314 family)
MPLRLDWVCAHSRARLGARVRIVAALLLILAASTAFAAPQTPVERAEKDELAFIHDNHPDMVAAMRKTRETLSDFLKLANNPRRSTTTFAVKIAVREDKQTEYFWISDFRMKDGQFSGRIDNTPRLVKRVRQDEVIAFAQDDVVDWMYIDRGRMRGTFTACAILKQESKKDAEAFKRRFRLECN